MSADGKLAEAAHRLRESMTCDAHPLDGARIDVPNCDCCDPCNAAREYDAALAAIDAEVAAAKANYPRCRDCGKWSTT